MKAKLIEKEQCAIANQVVENSQMDICEDDFLSLDLGEENIFDQENRTEDDFMNGKSTTYSPDRSTWLRPCFHSSRTIIMSDSIGANLQANIPNDWKFYSYRGLDLTEANCLLSHGYLPMINTKKSFLAEKNARSCYSSGARLPFQPFCEICGTKCIEAFSGNLYLCLGLNNYLKHSQKSFSCESANQLISNIERNCNHNFPFTNLIFTLPLKPADFKVSELWDNEYFFNSLVAEIVTKDFIGSIDFAQKNDLHGPDGIHLSPSGKTLYWDMIFNIIKNRY